VLLELRLKPPCERIPHTSGPMTRQIARLLLRRQCPLPLALSSRQVLSSGSMRPRCMHVLHHPSLSTAKWPSWGSTCGDKIAHHSKTQRSRTPVMNIMRVHGLLPLLNRPVAEAHDCQTPLEACHQGISTTEIVKRVGCTPTKGCDAPNAPNFILPTLTYRLQHSVHLLEDLQWPAEVVNRNHIRDDLCTHKLSLPDVHAGVLGNFLKCLTFHTNTDSATGRTS
jgi:hypothetical protein